MPTSARKRRSIDMRRLGMAASYPGIDPRTWVSNGRVEDDTGSIRWDPLLGWVIDVTLLGSALDGTDQVACRVLDEDGVFSPFTPGGEVLVGLPSGEAEGPVVLGIMHNQDGDAVPLEVNGLVINGESPTSAASFDSDLPVFTVSPFDTEFKNSPYNRREQYAGDYVIQAANAVIEGDQIRLAGRMASQSFVRGEDYQAVWEQVVNTGDDTIPIPVSIITVMQAIATAVDSLAGGGPVLAGQVQALKAYFETVAKLKFTAALSSRIKGE